MRYAYFKSGFVLDEARRTISGIDLARNGPDVFVADFMEKHADDELLILGRDQPRDTFVAGNVRVESFPTMGHGTLHRHAFKRVWSAIRIGFEMWRFRPDRIVCGTMGETLWASTIVAKLTRTQIVYACHNEVEHRRGFGSILSKVDNACIRACQGVVCHGPFLADQVRKLGVPSNRTHQFEIDLRGFVSTQSDLTLPAGLRSFTAKFKTVLIFLGRMQRSKGIFDMLTALTQLPDALRQTVGLVFVGEGKDTSVFNQRVSELGVADHVLSLGLVLHTQLPGVFRAVSAVVTPTRPEFPEGRCMVVLEALALGVPVIAPDSGPFPYAVRDGVNGLLFEPGDADALTECVRRIAQEEGVLAAISQGARDTAHEITASHQSFATAIDAAFAVRSEALQ